MMSKRPRLEARDQRAEFGEHAVDLRNAHLGEHRLGDFRRLAGQLAIGRGKAERRLIGEADADIAVGLGALQRGLRISRRQRGGGERKDSSGLDDRAAGQRRIDHILLPLLDRSRFPGMQPSVKPSSFDQEVYQLIRGQARKSHPS